jgi:hypothetical protein
MPKQNWRISLFSTTPVTARISACLRSPKSHFSPRDIRLERIQQIFARSSLKSLLDDKFLEGLQKRREDLQQRAVRLFVVEVTVLGVLLLGLARLEVNISFLGVTSSNLLQLRELLLIVYTSVNYFRFEMRAQSYFTGEIIRAGLKEKSGDDAELAYILEHRFGLGGFPGGKLFRPAATMYPGVGYIGLRLLLFVAHRIANLMTIAAILAVLIFAMIDICVQPSFNIVVSTIVTAYAVLIVVAQALWLKLVRDVFIYRSREIK